MEPENDGFSKFGSSKLPGFDFSASMLNFRGVYLTIEFRTLFMAITGGLDWENAMQPLPLGVSKVSNLRGERRDLQLITAFISPKTKVEPQKMVVCRCFSLSVWGYFQVSMLIFRVYILLETNPLLGDLSLDWLKCCGLVILRDIFSRDFISANEECGLVYSLKLAFRTLKIGHPKRKFHLPTIHFQVLLLLVSGRVYRYLANISPKLEIDLPPQKIRDSSAPSLKDHSSGHP